jgi:hypothetical protein
VANWNTTNSRTSRFFSSRNNDNNAAVNGGTFKTPISFDRRSKATSGEVNAWMQARVRDNAQIVICVSRPKSASFSSESGFSSLGS